MESKLRKCPGFSCTQSSGQTLIGPQLLSGALGTVNFFLLGMKSQQPGQTVGKYWEKECTWCQEGGSLVGEWCLFIKGDASSGGGARERVTQACEEVLIKLFLSFFSCIFLPLFINTCFSKPKSAA